MSFSKIYISDKYSCILSKKKIEKKNPKEVRRRKLMLRAENKEKIHYTEYQQI